MKKEGWFVKVYALIPISLAAAIFIWAGWMRCAAWSGNPECDEKCTSLGYPAGEMMAPAQWKHDVCVCWPQNPGPAGYFLLERD